MNLRNITLAFLGLTVLFSSCNSDTEYDLSTASKNAQISSFSLKGVHDKTLDSLERATDSVRFVILGKTKFAIDQVNDLIYNPDSLPYGFNLKTLLPTITYAGSPSSLKFDMKDALKEGVKDTVVLWNGSDSVNFAFKSIAIEVVPATQQVNDRKFYKLDLRIHKIDPDVMVWKSIANYPGLAHDRKAVLSGNTITTLTRTLSSGLLLEESNDAGLVTQKAVSGLPTNTKVLTFTYLDDFFYVLSEDGKTFKSVDGTSWAEVNHGKNVKEILGVAPGNIGANDRVVVLLEDAGSIHFGTTTDFSDVKELSAVPSDFPVAGFASITNNESIYRSKLFVGTGKNKSGNDLNSIWMLEMNGESLNVSKTGSSSFFSGIGNSLFAYDGKLYLYSKNKFYTSSNYGITWVKGSVKQELPSIMHNYTEQSVVVKGNTVWILGGKDSGGNYPVAIWTGTLNRLK